MDSNNARLIELMETHSLGRRDVARLTECRINRKTNQSVAVNKWLSTDPGNYRRMPDRAIALLELRLQTMSANERKNDIEGPPDWDKLAANARAHRRIAKKKKGKSK